MKKILSLTLCAMIIFVLTGCNDYINRSYTTEQAGERFDRLFLKIGDVLAKNDIAFDASDIKVIDEKKNVTRGLDCILDDGSSLSIWLTYTVHEDKTGTETFYCSVTSPMMDSFSEAYLDARDYRYMFDIGRRLSNIWSTGKSVREANKLVALVKQDVLTKLGTPPNGIFKRNVELSEKYNLWNISYSVQFHDDTGKYDSAFTYEGLVNV